MTAISNTIAAILTFALLLLVLHAYIRLRERNLIFPIYTLAAWLIYYYGAAASEALVCSVSIGQEQYYLLIASTITSFVCMYHIEGSAYETIGKAYPIFLTNIGVNCLGTHSGYHSSVRRGKEKS